MKQDEQRILSVLAAVAETSNCLQLVAAASSVQDSGAGGQFCSIDLAGILKIFALSISCLVF